MSYPYEDDLMFGSEAATCNQIQRVIIEGSVEPEPGPEPPQPTQVYYITETPIQAQDSKNYNYKFGPLDSESDSTFIGLLNASIADSTMPLQLMIQTNTSTSSATMLFKVGSTFSKIEPTSLPVTEGLPLTKEFTFFSADGASSFTLGATLVKDDGTDATGTVKVKIDGRPSTLYIKEMSE